MQKNLFIRASLTSHIIGAVLAHTDTVPFSVNSEFVLTVTFFYGKIRTVEAKQFPCFISVIFFTEDGNAFYISAVISMLPSAVSLFAKVQISSLVKIFSLI